MLFCGHFSGEVMGFYGFRLRSALMASEAVRGTDVMVNVSWFFSSTLDFFISQWLMKVNFNFYVITQLITSVICLFLANHSST